MIKIRIPIEPTGQMRPRRAKNGRMFKDPNQKRRESILLSYIIAAVKPENGYRPAIGPVELNVLTVMRRPKSHYGTGRNSGKLKTSAPYFCETTPDFDNLFKQICDCMNRLVFHDDRQVVKASIVKRYGANPRWEIDLKRPVQPEWVESSVCEWKVSEPDIDGETFESGCGSMWTFLTGGPKENGAKFCMFCGREILEVI